MKPRYLTMVCMILGAVILVYLFTIWPILAFIVAGVFIGVVLAVVYCK